MLGKYAKVLKENEVFLIFDQDRAITEVAEMLPPEAMQLIEVVISQCNANSV